MASLLLFFRTLSFFSFLFPSIQTLNLVGCSSWQRREISTIRFIVEFYLAGKGRPEEFDSDCHAEQKDKKRKEKTPPITSTTNTKSLLIKKQMGKATLAVKNSAAAKASASSRLVSNIVEEPQLVAGRASTTISSTNLERQ